jgi:hypothetical protein
LKIERASSYPAPSGSYSSPSIRSRRSDASMP